MSDIVLLGLLIGIGATAVMDLWALVVKTLFHAPGLNYGLVGRWVGHLFKGKIVHESILKSEPIQGETVIGWIVHYLTGILFAAGMLLVVNDGWLSQPTLLPAVLTGTLTLLFPFLIMQPSFGMGIAASRAPHPNKARLKSISSHMSFGIGLYVTAVALELLMLN